MKSNEGAVTVRRITRITFEADETVAIRRGRSSSEPVCILCGSHLGAVTPHEAAWLLQMEIAQVYREVEVGPLHLLSGHSEGTQVCLGSVEKAAQRLSPGTKIQIKHTEENS